MKYEKIRELGKGRDSVTYLIKMGKKPTDLYAMKIYKPEVKKSVIRREIKILGKLQKYRITPIVYFTDAERGYIVMEYMPDHLCFSLLEGRLLTKKQQNRILHIYSVLDIAGVFHNDANLANFMIKDGEIYLIDFGFSVFVTEKLRAKLGVEHVNVQYMSGALLKKLEEIGFKPKQHKTLSETVQPKVYRSFFE